MNLQEFLVGKVGTLEELLTLAQNEPKITGKLIHRDSMNSLLASAGMYNALKAVAADANNPDSDAMAAFLDSTEYNFMIGDGTTTGDRQIAAMDAIIATGTTLGQGLGAIRPYIMAMANKESPAFPDVTLTQIKTIVIPPVKTLCTHLDGSQDFIPSVSNRDTFLFLVDAAEPVERIKLSLRWKAVVEDPWITHEIGSIQGGKGLFSRSFGRPAGLGQARFFEYSVTSEYAGQLNSVTVNLG